MKPALLTILFATSIVLSTRAETIVALETFETPGSLGVWTATAGTVIYYNFSETDQPAGNLTHNFSSPGGEGAVDLRKSGGAITSPTLALANGGATDFTVSLDYQIHNGTTTRRTFWELSLDGGSTWFDLGLTQTGGDIANDTAGYSASVTIVEGVSGRTAGGSLKGSSNYDGSAFTDNMLVRFSNNGSAGADYRQFYDNIEITSTDFIPEPSSAVLAGLSGLMLLVRRRR